MLYNSLFLFSLLFYHGIVLGNKIKKPKPDRGKYTSKSKSRKADKLSESDGFVESTISAHEVELENMIQNLTQIHAEFYLKSDEGKTGDRVLELKEIFCRTVGEQLVQIIDWAKHLPGYCNLVISDQAILLQAAWVDLLVLNWLFHSVHSDESLRLSRMFSLTYAEAQEIGFENIYQHVLSLVMRAKKYDIDEEEISCLKAISLTNAGRLM